MTITAITPTIVENFFLIFYKQQKFKSKKRVGNFIRLLRKHKLFSKENSSERWSLINLIRTLPMVIKTSPKSFKILSVISSPEKKSTKILSDSSKPKSQRPSGSIEKTTKVLPWKLLQSRDLKLLRKKYQLKMCNKKVKSLHKNFNKNPMSLVLEAHKQAQWLPNQFIKLKVMMKMSGLP